MMNGYTFIYTFYNQNFIIVRFPACLIHLIHSKGSVLAGIYCLG